MIIRRPEPFSLWNDFHNEFAKIQLIFIIFNPINMILKKVLLEIVLPCQKYIFIVNLCISTGAKSISIGVEFISIRAEIIFIGTETISIGAEINSIGAETISIGAEINSIGAEIISIGMEINSI